MIGDPRPCDQCEEMYGESRDYGGTHWHCGNCGKISSYQGHYGLLPNKEWGFKCGEKDRGTN